MTPGPGRTLKLHYLGAFIPLAAAMVFATTSPRESAVEGERATAGLVFEQYFVNFGPRPIGPRPVLTVPFRYHNTTGSPIRIQKLQPSCGCLRPKIDSMIVPPGGSGELVMPVQTDNEAPGLHEYLVKVFYNDGQPREADLAMKVVLPEKQVLVEPRAVWFYQSGTVATEKIVTITDYRNQSFEILGIQSSSDLFTVSEESDEALDNGGRRLRLKVTVAATLPAGRHRGLIVVQTDDPRYRQIQIRVGAEVVRTGEPTAEPALAAEPRTLRLQPNAEGRLAAETRLSTRDGKVVDVVGLSVTPDAVKAEVTQENGATFLRVSAEQNDSGIERAVITVRTRGQEDRPATIPVVIPPQRHGGPK